jgi:flagellin
MGYVINTNINSMNSQVSSGVVQRDLSNSLEKLSSGLRINKAADDSSGMAIADSLRSQASSLGQAIRNANDAIGVIQIADKAMDEQLKILDTIKAKANQSAMDTQSRESRQAIQKDISRLIEQLDNIANTTSYNGIKLLSGAFTNKEFQIGAYSNETIKTSIGATSSDKIGTARRETTNNITGAGNVTLTFSSGTDEVTLESVIISTSADTGIGVLAEAINKNSNTLGVRASFQVQSTGTAAIAEGTVSGLTINGVAIGDVVVKDNDDSASLRNAINAFSTETGVNASVDISGRLNLTSNDGRGIAVTATADTSTNLGTVAGHENYGRLTMTKLSSKDIVWTAAGAGAADLNDAMSGGWSESFSLRAVNGNFTSSNGLAMGAYANDVLSGDASALMGAGVTTKTGSMMVMDMAESATQLLDTIRADLGSVQQQLNVTINNISVTQVNVKAAESGIRDVDFAAESANFSKNNILAQSGTYAMSQANAIQQNVLRLLQ